MIKYTQEELRGFTDLQHEKIGAHREIKLSPWLFCKSKDKEQTLDSFPFCTIKLGFFERKGTTFF